MATIMVKKCPEELHKQIKTRAMENHRSMNKEIIWILQREVMGNKPVKSWRDIQPLKARVPLTDEWLKNHKREGLA